MGAAVFLSFFALGGASWGPLSALARGDLLIFINNLLPGIGREGASVGTPPRRRGSREIMRRGIAF